MRVLVEQVDSSYRIFILPLWMQFLRKRFMTLPLLCFFDVSVRDLLLVCLKNLRKWILRINWLTTTDCCINFKLIPASTYCLLFAKQRPNNLQKPLSKLISFSCAAYRLTWGCLCLSQLKATNRKPIYNHYHHIHNFEFRFDS